jgi:hypothetical protein
MTRSLFEPATRQDVLRRMRSIDPARAPLWGKMSAGKMLAHVNAALAMALGELETRPKRSPLANPLGRLLFIYLLPWPRGAPTAPELLAQDASGWDDDLPRFAALLERFAARAQGGSWPRHPAFGQMNAKQWGDLEFRHVDHHLRQFGV